MRHRNHYTVACSATSVESTVTETTTTATATTTVDKEAEYYERCPKKQV